MDLRHDLHITSACRRSGSVRAMHSAFSAVGMDDVMEQGMSDAPPLAASDEEAVIPAMQTTATT
jgi:hypothetical protein